MRNSIFITILLMTSFIWGGTLYAKAKDPSLFSIKEPWIDQNGKEFLFSSLKGKKTVLAMVYTNCEYSCPLITQKMKKIHEKISEKPKSHVRFLLITFDPSRDTSEKLKKYSISQKLDESSFSLLTSSEKNTHMLSIALNFQYKKMNNGHFSHSSQITVLDKDGVIVHQQDITKDLDAIIKVIQSH